MGLLATLALAVGLGGIGQAYDEVEVPDGGTITGQVKYVGPAQTLAPLKVTKDPDLCGKEAPSETLLISANGEVRYAVVFLEGISQGKKIDRTKETWLTQEKCHFGPHVFTMVKGTDLSVKNADPFLHNANMAVNGIQMFNFGQPKKDQVIIKRVRKTGLVEVTCDSHPHMEGHFMVFDHPYHAVTGPEGTFTLDQIPPGKYTVKLWHESWKVKGQDEDGRPIYEQSVVLNQEIEVPTKGMVRVNFELK
ncbi:MAG: hypothetical protein HYS70_02375 [Nitrospinae bacterium]|nr:hypothetical protein [Nitrospinota bacterium]